MDGFLVKKWNHVFNTFFDTNKSHALEWADFELLIEKIKQQRGADSDAYTKAQTAMKDIWQGLVTYADLNKDNKVSLDEWQQMWNSVYKDKKYPEWQDTYLQYMFRLLDSSGDNLIDVAEYTTVMELYGVKTEESKANFQKIAFKGGKPVDGIDFDTFKGLWSDYFLSTDAGAIGNSLFGKVA